MSAKDIANQAKAIVPFLMAQLNNPELTTEVTAAVGKFLDDPKSLEIAAEPPAAGAVRADHGGRDVQSARPAQDARRPRHGERRLIESARDMKKPGIAAGLFVRSDADSAVDGTGSATPSSVLLGRHDAQRQFAKLLRRRRRRRVHQQVLGLLVHREQRDLAQVLRADQQHDDAVDAGRHAAMRRRAILEGAVEAAEALLDGLAVQPDQSRTP